ncbi:hypothetical protein A2U01_0078982, partial [Trifolium medium]|nr:hypothetical protein [Trifolium medium]
NGADQVEEFGSSAAITSAATTTAMPRPSD